MAAMETSTRPMCLPLEKTNMNGIYPQMNGAYNIYKDNNNTPDNFDQNAKYQVKLEVASQTESSSTAISPNCNDPFTSPSDPNVFSSSSSSKLSWPCSPGLRLLLEGVVWHETVDGILVVNITWRGRNYVGTLLDHTKHDFTVPSPQQLKQAAVANNASNNGPNITANSQGFPEVFEEKRSSKRSTNNSNPVSTVGSFNSAYNKRNSTSNNTQASLSQSNQRNQNHDSSSSGSSTTAPASVGRTTNNSIAAEYDATSNGKVKVHAVSPLVSCSQNQSVANPGQPGSTTPSTKPKRGAPQSGTKTPPPLTIVEDSPSTASAGATTYTTGAPLTSGVKRKSEKNGGDASNGAENRTGKKPRVTITSYGANNETLTSTTILSTPSEKQANGESLWKCYETGCNKKYKHKNGLKYHITHVHARSEQEADAIIESTLISFATNNIATETGNLDEDSLDSGSKVVSPTGNKTGAGKKNSYARKSSSAKEKKKSKRDESDGSVSGTDSGSNGAISSSGNQDFKEERPKTVSPSSQSEVLMSSEQLESTSQEDTRMEMVENNVGDISSRTNMHPVSTPITTPTKVVLPLNTPQQDLDSSGQPERKVAKVAPSNFAPVDPAKVQQNGIGHQISKVEPSVIPGQMIPVSVAQKPVQPTPQSATFPIQTPMYPFGHVDPKLYTNFVGSAFTPQGHQNEHVSNFASCQMDTKSPAVKLISPKPEGTAARIVHNQSQNQSQPGFVQIPSSRPNTIPISPMNWNPEQSNFSNSFQGQQQSQSRPDQSKQLNGQIQNDSSNKFVVS